MTESIALIQLWNCGRMKILFDLREAGVAAHCAESMTSNVTELDLVEPEDLAQHLPGAWLLLLFSLLHGLA
jgi:hypothetical protein